MAVLQSDLQLWTSYVLFVTRSFPHGSGLVKGLACETLSHVPRPYRPHLHLQVKGLVVVTVNRGCQVCNCCSWGIAKLNITCEKYCTAVGNFNRQLGAQDASKLR